MSEINDNIIRKIQKLLALGQRGGTEAEASAAMAMAQELLAKYNLDMAVIQNAAVEGGTVVAKEKRERTKINKSAMYKWQQELCRVIADCNFCYYWPQEFMEPYQSKHGPKYRNVKRHMIVGKEVNVVAVTIMYEYLAEIMEELLPYPNAERLSRSAMSWREGCAERLMYRIRVKFREMQDASDAAMKQSGKMGLVLRSVYLQEYEANYDALCGEGSYAQAVKQYQEAKKAPKKELTAAEKAKQEKADARNQKKAQREFDRRMAARDRDAYYAGCEAGNSISLHDRLKTGSN